MQDSEKGRVNVLLFCHPWSLRKCKYLWEILFFAYHKYILGLELTGTTVLPSASESMLFSNELKGHDPQALISTSEKVST